MSQNPWDNQQAPNLSKLPAHIREKLSAPIPLRPNEVYGQITIFKNEALVHPNGRILALPYVEDPTEIIPTRSLVELQLSDFSARRTLGAVVLRKKELLTVLQSLVQAYFVIGGTEQELLETVPLPHKISLNDGKSIQSTPSDFIEDLMEKYGVDETKSTQQKCAEDPQMTCPLCGQQLLIHGNVVLCPKHGSKPFETDDDDDGLDL